MLLDGESKENLFFKGSRSGRHKNNQPGDGMGLFVVKCICDYLGVNYRVGVENIKGDRARFVFNFEIPRAYVLSKKTGRFF